MAYTYHKPVIGTNRTGDSIDPFRIITNDVKKIVNGKVTLEEIPDYNNHVLITNVASPYASEVYYETFDYTTEISRYNYRVDYNNGVVYFNQLANARFITLSYVGTGYDRLHISRIVSKEQNGEVVETLENIIDSGRDAIDVLPQVNAVIANAVTATNNANTATNNANTATTNTTAAALNANDKANLANTATTNANQAAQNANDKATLANTAATNATEKANLANDKATLADTAANLANEKATLADTKATLANDKANLADTAATNANSKANLANDATIAANNATAAAITATENANDSAELADIATTEANNTNNSINTAEGLRVAAEQGRDSAESIRIINENARMARDVAYQLCEEYNPNKDYIPLNKVTYLGFLYQNTVACKNILPTDETKWICIAKKGDYYVGDTAPVSPYNNQIWFDTTDASIKYWNGSQWISTAGSGNMTYQVYDNNNDGKVNSADVADSLTGLSVSVSELNYIGGVTSSIQTQFNNATNEINTISDKISSGSVITPTIGFGMNSKIQIPEMPTAPKFKFKGFSVVNLLGKDGNCEDISKWSVYQCTPTLDSTNKMYGTYSIKATLTATSGTFYMFPKNIDVSKYYMVTVYIKIGNATRAILRKSNDGATLNIVSPEITDTSKFTRVIIKATPAQMTSGDAIAIDFVGTAGQYIYIDGFMLNEISATDYALSDAELLVKYPYVDSYACLQNPYFENRRYNLVRNGNCEEGIGYWQFMYGTGTISVENGKFKLVTTSAYTYWGQTIKVKPNTNYYLSGNWSGNGFFITLNSGGSQLHDGLGVINTGDSTEIHLILHGGTTAGTTYFDSIMLVEGTTAPTAYKSCDLQRFVIEGQFTQDDQVNIENGKVSGLLNWKHRTLYGKDYDWQINANPSGSKEIVIMNREFSLGVASNSYLIKYDGQVLKSFGEDSAVIAGDQYRAVASLNYFLIGIPNLSSGWIDAVQPNSDEIKSYMNGWRTLSYDVGVGRYNLWANLSKPTSVFGTDTSVYPSGTATTLTAPVTTGNTSITVADASIFKIGEVIFIYGQGGVIITNIVGNVITTAYGAALDFAVGRVVVRGDNPTGGDYRIVNYCKTNVSSGYEGYQLHYKLANPEPITDINTHVHGEIWDMVKGDNYITVDSGIVLAEIANAVLYGTNYGVNNTLRAGSNLKYKAEIITGVYHNSIYDAWVLRQDDIYAIGRADAYIDQGKYDTSATYTVDYQILKTIHAQSFGSLSLSYSQSVIATLEGHSKELEQKQAKSSVLDDINDLASLESIVSGGDANGTQMPYRGTRTWFTQQSQTNVAINIPFKVTKNTVPYINIKSWSMVVTDNIGNPTTVKAADILNGSPIVRYVTKDYVVINVVLLAGTLADNALNCGAYVTIKLDADCRKKV